MKIDLPKTKGCHSIQIFQDDKDPCVFTLLEVWETKGHHKAHIGTLIITESLRPLETPRILY